MDFVETNYESEIEVDLETRLRRLLEQSDSRHGVLYTPEDEYLIAQINDAVTQVYRPTKGIILECQNEGCEVACFVRDKRRMLRDSNAEDCLETYL